MQVVFILFQLAVGVVLALCLTGQPAKAYADPGSGAVLWQLLFASIVSIGFHFRRVRLWFTNRRSQAGADHAIRQVGSPVIARRRG